MNMKTLMKTFILAVLAVMLCTSTALAQTSPTRTTLSVAMAAGARTMTVTSATGFSVNTNSAQGYVLVESDLRTVLGISGTVISLGPARNSGVGHINGSTVIFGTVGNWSTGTAGVASGSTGVFLPSIPTGSCLRVNQQFLPLFVVSPSSATTGNSATVDCQNGQWVVGALMDAVDAPYITGPCTVPIGSVAYGSFGTSTTASTTGEFTASVFVPYTMLASGITQLNGSAVDGASKKIVILHDSGGALIANSTTAGTAATGNDAFQSIAFTSAVILVGPANYFIGLQDDTADVNGVRTIATATFKNVVASSITSVFGTVGAVTVPTTFTADTGPIACIN